MKNINLIEKNKTNGNFRVLAGLLCILLASIMARDIDQVVRTVCDKQSPDLNLGFSQDSGIIHCIYLA